MKFSHLYCSFYIFAGTLIFLESGWFSKVFGLLVFTYGIFCAGSFDYEKNKEENKKKQNEI